MKQMSLSAKLIVLFLLVGLIPFFLISAIAYFNASNALSEKAYGQLEAMRAVKKDQIERFFAERKGDMGVLMETVNTLRTEAFDKLDALNQSKKSAIETYFSGMFSQMDIFAGSRDVKALYDRLVAYHNDMKTSPTGSYDISTPEYQMIWETLGAPVEKFYKDSGVYDVFLICAKHGHVMYSAAKEKDLGENMGHGRYKDSGLADLWKKITASDKPAIVDMAPYAPSNGDPAMFAGYPVKAASGEMIGIIAFQLPLDQINAVMTTRHGMGATGESYLVGQDKLMRSDSFLDPENHSVKASFANPGSGRVDTEASRSAFAGKAGQDVISDYNGNPVLSCFDTITIQDLTWAIITEMDVAEAFCPKDDQGEFFFEKYTQMYGYYDLFLFNPDGYAFYTVAQESDYQTNFLTGKYADSNLGNLIKKVLQTKAYAMADFAPYAPSNNAPCAFIAQPVVHNGDIEMVAALQLSLKAINAIMQEREGMGETGETYLVGSDKLMRSDSFLDPAAHSVKASFADPSKGSVDTQAANLALTGNTGAKIITDYNGNPVLSAFTPVNIGNTVWALIAEIDESEAFAAVNAIKWLILIISVVSAGVIFAVAFFIARSISKPINAITLGMDEGAAQVASASSQVSSSSQSMAEGASQQAASIEESSSSMEEMSSMTKKNAENASHADALMKEANQVVTRANASMGELTHSMEDISTASEETSKIIKTIDEIAFQTNLLALNAAVEAARAGEAGAGFAVVADEVRNLAMRAAEAARNTAELIEGTVKKVNDGSRLVSTTNEAFGQVAESAAKVGDLIAEISAASKEQSSGIEQVNIAITEMDKVVQQNAANAEESASASEEMNAQAEQLKEYVEDLVMLVTGKRDRNQAVARKKSIKNVGLHQAKKISSSNKPAAVKSGEVRSDQVIPFDDDEDFKNF
ncbi:MAG TPA: methyl-accepting chemotaxis protein [Desulfotignum sp.]|nr:methyl-accepting chemotaxis protein [Desulfotignum sp.]